MEVAPGPMGVDVYDTMYVVPRIIDKSITKELLATFFITLAFLNAVLMMEKMLRLSRFLSGVGATFYNISKILFYLQPQLLPLTVPMSQLLAILLVYGRMNQDSELTILRTCGVDFTRTALPVMFLGLFCFVSSIAVSFFIGPGSSVRLKHEITNTIASGSARALEEGTFNTSFKDVVILVKGKSGSDVLQNIFIYDSRVKQEPKVLMAKTGELLAMNGLELGLYLKNGYINIAKGRNTTELFFDKYRLALTVDYETTAPQKNELDPAELAKKMRASSNAQEKASYSIAFHRRLTLPVICLVLVLLGPALAQFSGKSGRLGGLATGLLVFTLYYMALIYGENLVLAGRIPLPVGSWAPITILMGLSLFLFRREQVR